jgi:magnesium transporter
MIRCLIRDEAGNCATGDVTLLQSWTSTNEGRLWLDIEGHFDDATREILKSIGCDELAIKDCFRNRHPPKVEAFNDNTFILFRGISTLDEGLELVPQQVGLWVGKNYVISVHRGTSVSVDYFWSLAHESLLDQPPTQLALRLLHYASGRYLEALLQFEERLGELEDGLLSEQSESDMKTLVSYRANLRRLRRTLNYHNNVSETILKTGTDHLGTGDDEFSHARRDLHDRCERNYSLCNLYYELCGDLIEGHISLSSHNLNQTMKVLTIISALFVPLTFLAGIYGMNFENMPELKQPNGYFILLGVMGIVAAVMIGIFRRIKWL